MSQDPFAADFQDVPQKSNKTCLIVTAVLGFLVLGCLCCGGGSYVMFWFGLEELGNQATAAIADNEVVKEHVGEIQSHEMLFMESIQYWTEGGGPQNKYILQLNGSKANAKLRILLDQNTGTFNPDSAELVLADGTVVPLTDAEGESSVPELPESGEPDAPAPAPDTAAPNN